MHQFPSCAQNKTPRKPMLQYNMNYTAICWQHWQITLVGTPRASLRNAFYHRNLLTSVSGPASLTRDAHEAVLEQPCSSCAVGQGHTSPAWQKYPHDVYATKAILQGTGISKGRFSLTREVRAGVANSVPTHPPVDVVRSGLVTHTPQRTTYGLLNDTKANVERWHPTFLVYKCKQPALTHSHSLNHSHSLTP